MNDTAAKTADVVNHMAVAKIAVPIIVGATVLAQLAIVKFTRKAVTEVVESETISEA